MATKQTVETTKEPTIEELEKMLQAKKDAARKEAQAKRSNYEKSKDDLIKVLGMEAVNINRELADFKNRSMSRMNEFRAALLEYGDIRKGEANKGNYEIKNESFKITFSSQVNKRFDERSELAEEKLKSFLSKTIKKRDRDTHDLVLSLLERNAKSGDLDISNIQRLYKMEDRFEEQDWKDAIRLFKESYNAEETKTYIRFFYKDENGAWKALPLSFPAL
jgi:hypothetical protein